MGPTIAIDSEAPTLRESNRHLVCGRTHRIAVNGGSKIIDLIWVNNHASSLPQNGDVVNYLFVTIDNIV